MQQALYDEHLTTTACLRQRRKCIFCRDRTASSNQHIHDIHATASISQAVVRWNTRVVEDSLGISQ